MTLTALPRTRVRGGRQPDESARSETVYRPRSFVELAQTLAVMRRGPGDPTMLVAGSVVWRAERTPEGAATLAFRQCSDGIRIAAWGSGREWALAHAPQLCGSADCPENFDAGGHPLLTEAQRLNPGLRLNRTDLVFDALVGAILEQKVTAIQAFASWRTLVRWCGERAPGPTPRPMYVPPTVDGWRTIPSWTWHRAGVEPPQSRAVVEAAQRASSLIPLVEEASPQRRDELLTSLRGVGAWTSAEVRIRAFGDPDAVSVGDYHLAHEIGYALTGKRVDDDGMLELLEPWRGQRQRAIRLLLSTVPAEPRRGPRLHPEDHRAR